MKGKDLSKPSVIRHFCRVLNTALFALVLCFTLNNAMALSRNCPAGTYAYLSTECRTCPANCWCPTNGSKQGTGYTTVTCYINDFVGPIEDQWSNANIENGSFDLNSCYLKNNLFPASDAGSDSVTDCYVQLNFSSDNNEESREKLYTYLHGIDNSIFIDGSLIIKRCYNNSSGSATTCDIPKLPQPIGDYWYISPKQHFTGEWCSGEELEVTNAQNSNFVTVKIKDGISSIGPCREYNKYTLLFDANGATGTPSDSSVSCMCGTGAVCTTSDVGTMTKTGYTFNGWNTAADGTGTTYKKGHQYNFCSNSVSDGTNIVLYAIWIPNNYTISLKKDDYTFSSYIYTTYDVGVYTDSARTTEMSTTANPATIPEKTGYTFQGFYSTSSGDGIQYILPNGLITSAGLSAAKWTTSGQTWYARWTPNNYTISLNKNGGTGGITTLYTTYGVDVYTDAARTTYEAPLSLPTKAGWTFQGFYSTSSGDGKQYITSNGYRSSDGTYAAKWTASNQTWYARWTPNDYTISLNNNGGWGVVTTLYTTYNTAVYTDSARTTEMSTSANPINVPTKTDWVFQGFYSTSSGVGTQYISSDGFITSAGLNAAKDAMPSQTWYARWGFAGNTVNLYSNCPGGSNTLVATIGVIQNKYMPETDVDGNRLLKPTCPGYRFLGYWDQTSGGKQYYDHTLLIDDEDGGLDTKWDKTSGGNLYAHWEQIPDGFSVDINTSDDEFAFYLTAAGTFKIYWGDGEVDTITKDTTEQQRAYHEYNSSGEYTITITGTSRGYSADTTVPVIEFTYDDGDTRALYGSLGTVFPTLSSTSINGAITQPSFAGTFRDNYKITSIPETLFDNIGGIPVPHMFDSTFENCDSLVTLPTNLFPVFTTNSISNAHHMFYETFYDCGQLVSIPSNLFAGVRGAPAEYMFAHTFDECDNITSVPAGLFNSISGSLAPYAFQETFYNCRRLETIPADLFSGLSGTPVEGAFGETFDSDSNLKYFKYPNGTTVSFIPPTFFGNIDVSNYQTEHSSYISERDGKEYPDISSWVADDMFNGTQVLEKCPSGYEEYLTGFEEEYAPKVSCVPACTSGQMRYNNECTTPDFTLTTTSNTEEFAFDITAAGTWYVDWGDGHIQKIYRPTATEDYTDNEYSSDNTKYYHNYSNPGVYTIKMKGRATDYAGNDEIGSINFAYQGYEDYIASVTGSLGVMFPTINGFSPSFYKVFEDVDNFTGEIPAGLFSGVTECRDHMFEYAFSYGRFTKVPSGLFANIQNNCASTFEDTFYSCQNLTTVESNAFPSETNCGDREYALTFEEAENLVNIPADMFASNTDGCEEMFYGTFINTGLTSIPSGLFANTKYTSTAMFKETFAGTKITEVPSGLFAKLEYTDENLFYHTFADCENLTTIPADLFSGLSGSSYPSTGTFYQMFNNDGNLQYFKYPDGTTVEYIPPTFFGALEDSGYVSSSQDTVATGMFSGTNILETCPAGTEEFNSVFKTEYAPKVSCSSTKIISLSYIDSFDNSVIETTPQMCTYNEAFNLPDTPTRIGYKFTGWELVK